MIVTARQLDDLNKLHGGNGRIVLPYRARLTPLAADYVRARKITIGYSEVAAAQNTTAMQPAATLSGIIASPAAPSTSASGAYFWWCDGPCGPAKAAVVAEEKLAMLRPLEKPADPRQLIHAIKALAAEVKAGHAAGAVLLVQNGALATVYANRCPSLRAILGTCLESVEQGVQQIAANVLIVEYPHKTLQQIRNMFARFLRAQRTLSEDARRQLQELASCG